MVSKGRALWYPRGGASWYSREGHCGIQGEGHHDIQGEGLLTILSAPMQMSTADSKLPTNKA